MLGFVALLNAALVFTETNIQLPVQLVLDSPMLAQGFGIPAGSHPPAADKVMHLCAHFACHRPFPHAHPHGRYLRSRLPVAQAVHVMDDHIRAFLVPAMALFAGGVLGDDTFG